jgi:hypothetical protein
VWGLKHVRLIPYDPRISQMRMWAHAHDSSLADDRREPPLPLRGQRGYSTYLLPGELLLMPSKMWHYYRAIKPSASFVMRARSFHTKHGFCEFARGTQSPLCLVSGHGRLWQITQTRLQTGAWRDIEMTRQGWLLATCQPLLLGCIRATLWHSCGLDTRHFDRLAGGPCEADPLLPRRQHSHSKAPDFFVERGLGCDAGDILIPDRSGRCVGAHGERTRPEPFPRHLKGRPLLRACKDALWEQDAGLEMLLGVNEIVETEEERATAQQSSAREFWGLQY